MSPPNFRPPQASRASLDAPEIIQAWRRRARTFEAGARIADAVNARHFHFVHRGWLARSRTFSNGGRQIIALLLPGDHWRFSGALGSADVLTSLSTASVASISCEEVEGAQRGCEALRAWFGREDRRRFALLENYVANLGRRDAVARTAHLFCELLIRNGAVGSPAQTAFPLTQSDLSDVLGLSAVHTNRVLQGLRRSALVQLSRGVLKVPDVPALARFASFDDGYLAGAQGEATLQAAS